MKILFVGDVFGKTGRRALARRFPALIDEHRIDFSIANVENAADGHGITPRLVEEFLDLGLDCLTSGNHIWDQREILDYIGEQPKLLRPQNYPPESPGRGLYIGESPAGIRVGVLNLMGRVFMNTFSCPFRTVDEVLGSTRPAPAFWIVDMHAEATSEKIAMGWHLDGRVAAVVGTHTHVQTADERVLPGGTAYITDIGMTGPYDSVIGVEKDLALQRFLSYAPVRFKPARLDNHVAAVVIEVDESSGRSRAIHRLFLPDEG
jgi:metallophosphoesterase (TIGR00282 family)